MCNAVAERKKKRNVSILVFLHTKSKQQLQPLRRKLHAKTHTPRLHARQVFCCSCCQKTSNTPFSPLSSLAMSAASVRGVRPRRPTRCREAEQPAPEYGCGPLVSVRRSGPALCRRGVRP